ncbi:hypothetical protein C8D88_105465 [Lentzea atacamensis]|uniref:Uncharacterized protein n=2 Tax=Lentzea TaxID=165301 RepID=A0A316I0D8_9PSEU|nr:hypothetical protein [Lentzea atacamensis]PWK86416.1 hypothetical protein C8D88_105465 [Lentzea atacamensis]RAS59796.1 hypothetical protein C8D87_113102 [Lentzea atacamensis]
MPQSVAGNVVLFAIAAVAPSALFWAVVNLPRALRKLRRPALVAGNPPIECIAADLRRVRRVLSCFPPGTSAIKRIGARQAYDELLIQACAALDVEHRLRSLPEGVDRDIERLRLEECLRNLGLSV